MARSGRTRRSPRRRRRQCRHQLPPGPVGLFDADNFRRLVEVNFVGAFNILHVAAQRVEDGGNIIAPTNLDGAFRRVRWRSLHCVEGGGQKPDLLDVQGAGAAPDGHRPVPRQQERGCVERSGAMSPFNRVGLPEELAEVVAFLASEKASGVQGQIVQPNGGMI
jgi:3-oxoacyl-[acyl-carrier protein] reductase